MKKVITSLAVFIAALALGFAGFVWWKLQPRPDPQPLPAALVAHDSAEGKSLIEGADARADYQPLSDAFEHQTLVSFCGVASGVTVLNAMGRNLTQRTFFTDDTDPVRSRFQVMFGGMSLPELAGFVHVDEARLHRARAQPAGWFRGRLTCVLVRSALRIYGCGLSMIVPLGSDVVCGSLGSHTTLPFPKEPILAFGKSSGEQGVIALGFRSTVETYRVGDARSRSRSTTAHTCCQAPLNNRPRF
jgi:hypothetical protein